jgi:RNA polymerase sigma-70 factor (ECF subfamily)
MMAMVASAPPVAERSREALVRETVALRPAVRAVIAAMLRESFEHPDVEDCTHEALRRAIEGCGRLRDGEPLRPWALGIARHVALDALRARTREARRRLATTSDADDEASDAFERVADAGPSALERADSAQRVERLRVALDGLPKGQRDAIRLFHLEGLGYKEIAARLGVPLGTVATWVTRARAALSAVVSETA